MLVNQKKGQKTPVQDHIFTEKKVKILKGIYLSTRGIKVVDKLVYLWITSVGIVAPEVRIRNSGAGFVKLMSGLGLVYNLCKKGVYKVEKHWRVFFIYQGKVIFPDM